MYTTYVRISCLMIVSSSIMFGLYRGFIYLLTPASYLIIHDVRLARDYQKMIADSTRNSIGKGHICSAMLEQLPCLQTMYCALKPVRQGILRYTLKAPVAIIKTAAKQYILTEDGLFVEQEYYDTPWTESLITITYRDHCHPHNAQCLIKWLMSVPPEIFEQFTCEWLDKTHITLQPINAHNYSVVITNSTLFNDRFFRVLEHITQEINKRATSRHKKKDSWIIDMRGHDQILLKKKGSA